MTALLRALRCALGCVSSLCCGRLDSRGKAALAGFVASFGLVRVREKVLVSCRLCLGGVDRRVTDLGGLYPRGIGTGGGVLGSTTS